MSAALGIGALVSFTGTALAQNRDAALPRIRYSSSDRSCPSAAAFNARFESLVGPIPESSAEASVNVKRVGRRFAVTVRIRRAEGSGERRVSADTCQLAIEAAALITAMSLFPERAEEIQKRAQASEQPEEPPEEPEASTPEPPPQSVTTEPRKTAKADTRDANAPALSLIVSAGAALDAISMPKVALGAFVGAGVVIFESIELSVLGAYFFAQEVEQTAGRGATFSHRTLALRGCYRFRLAASSVAPCLGAQGIHVSGVGEGTDREYEQTWIYGGPSAGVAARVGIYRALSLRVEAHGFVNLARPRFLLNAAEIHRPSAVGLSAFMGPELEF